VLPLTLRSRGAADRPRTGDPDVGNVTLWPTELQPHGACSETRTPATALPRRRAAATTKQAKAGEARFGRAPWSFKDSRAASYPIPHSEPPPGPEPGPPAYKADALPIAPRRQSRV
jgi:hypothetical protein